MSTMLAIRFVSILLVGAGICLGQLYTNVMKVEATTGAAIQVGDAANNAIRVNIVAGGGSGGTSSSFGAAFPATGTAVGFNDGTNMQGGRVVDADTGAGTVYTQIVNLVRRASGGPTEMIGQTTMAASLPVVLASDQSAFTVNVGTFPDNEPFNLAQYGGAATGAGNALHVQPGTGAVFAASQNGTWTVQPGNTANTTPWFAKMVPLHGCAGNTLQDITQADVATGVGSALTSADTCVFKVHLTNVTSSPVTATIRDKQATPIEYIEGLAIPANSTATWEFGGMKFVSGVQAIAGTASALNARLTGVQ